ncbi:hypothetical protein XENTR_v10003669 [Xenopus tropicalis]|uniref:Leucine-rich repeat-containing protein 46 isoform X1 n=1 Tax=Xenopus tropicalis TaxID=8364 RepID=A0A8J1IXA9_XENTR|nr:leucine-rich repeat-containing protein 46 isoform X1 [Xenopus tropicalis]KAE8575021.1 hypothetical protein XENTR_v10003669 [Xenopus tropicalis]
MAGGDTEITIQTIARRNLDPSLQNATGQRLAEALLLLHSVRLDRERITRMSSLECVRETHSLYLQENLIKKIENLELLKNLRFLSLSGNRIEEVTNLHSLLNLQFLDLSHNLIQRVNEGELPPKLLALDLRENGCTHAPDYRQKVMTALPLLQELDGEIVSVKQSQEFYVELEEEDESDADDPSLSYTDSGSLSSVRQDILERSQHRKERALKEHRERLEEVIEDKDFLALSEQIPGVNVLSEHSSSTAEPQGSASCLTGMKNTKPEAIYEENSLNNGSTENGLSALAKTGQDVRLNHKTSKNNDQVLVKKSTSQARAATLRPPCSTGQGSRPDEGKSKSVPSSIKPPKLPASAPSPKLPAGSSSSGKPHGISVPSSANKRLVTNVPSSSKARTVSSAVPSQSTRKPPTNQPKTRLNHSAGQKK